MRQREKVLQLSEAYPFGTKHVKVSFGTITKYRVMDFATVRLGPTC